MNRTRLAAAVVAAATVVPTTVAVTATAAQAATYTATIAVNPGPDGVGETGEPLRLSGTVKGGAVKGKKVTVYARFVGEPTWTKVSSPKLSSKGAWSSSYTPSYGGDTEFKVVKATSGKTKGVTTTSSSVKVFDWISEYSFRFEATATPSDALSRANGSINGASYRGLVQVKDGGSVLYPLGAKECDRVRGEVGVLDSSTDTSGKISLAYFFPFAEVGVAKQQDPVAFSTRVAPGSDVAIWSTTGATNSVSTTSSMAFTDLAFHCNYHFN